MQNQTFVLRDGHCRGGHRGALHAEYPAVKNAEEVYKNIVQLKGTPSDQLMPAMQFISSLARSGMHFLPRTGKDGGRR